MQKIVFKRAIPFRTTLGTIETDTIIAESSTGRPDEVIDVVGVVDRSLAVVRYGSKCVFSKNSIIRTEPFSEEELPPLSRP
ncbi:hypothetical protein [Humidesulfovibrio idahonensis]